MCISPYNAFNKNVENRLLLILSHHGLGLLKCLYRAREAGCVHFRKHLGSRIQHFCVFLANTVLHHLKGGIGGGNLAITHILDILLVRFLYLTQALFKQRLTKLKRFQAELCAFSGDLFVDRGNVALQLYDRVSIVVIRRKECEVGITADNVGAGVVGDGGKVLELCFQSLVLGGGRASQPVRTCLRWSA